MAEQAQGIAKKKEQIVLWIRQEWKPQNHTEKLKKKKSRKQVPLKL